jgi:hypothetical protein
LDRYFPDEFRRLCDSPKSGPFGIDCRNGIFLRSTAPVTGFSRSFDWFSLNCSETQKGVKRARRVQFFSLGTVSASGSLFLVILSMTVAPPFALTFLVSVVYAVVPFSLWSKSRNLLLRIVILTTCIFGFGIILAAVAMKLWPGDSDALFPGMRSLLVAIGAGIVFLPMAAIGSFVTLLHSRRSPIYGELHAGRSQENHGSI